MTKLWELLKSIVAKLLNWFRRKPSIQVEPPANLAQEGNINQAKLYLPNMPKYQPCPNGHGWKKRVRKTLGGAHYQCNRCGDFFVRVIR